MKTTHQLLLGIILALVVAVAFSAEFEDDFNIPKGWKMQVRFVIATEQSFRPSHSSLCVPWFPQCTRGSSIATFQLRVR